MTEQDQKQLGKTLWDIADQLRGAMNADDFRDYMLSFLFLRYLSDNYESAAQKELGKDYPKVSGDDRSVPLAIWYDQNPDDVVAFEKQMRRKAHYIVKPEHLWNSIANLARMQDGEIPRPDAWGVSARRELYELGQDPREACDLARSSPQQLERLITSLERYSNFCRENGLEARSAERRAELPVEALKELQQLGYL